MAFQASGSVRQFQTTGLAGEFAREGPQRVSPWILNSAGGSNPIGLAYTKESDGKVQLGGTGVFIGILGFPKEHALVGVGTSALSPTNVLANDIVAELISMGIIYVDLASLGNVGDAIKFIDATGVIDVGAPGAGETAIANTTVVLEDISAPGLGIIQLGF